MKDRCSRSVSSSRWLLIVAVLAMLLPVTPLEAAPQRQFGDSEPRPEPWPGPEKAFIAIEGESFTPQGEGWAVTKAAYRREQIAAGNNAVLAGVKPGKGTAVREIEAPEAGDYRLLVRHTRWTNDSRPATPFKLTVSQDGAIVAEHRFDGTDGVPVVSRSAEPHWAEFVVTERSVKLAKGPATLTLEKTGPEVGHATQRWVDQVILTQDKEYKYDYRDFMPQSYVQLHLHEATFQLEPDAEPQPAPGYFYCFVNHTRAPWYENIRFAADGFDHRVSSSAKQYVAPGESTPWSNVSRVMYPASDTMFKFQVTRAYHNPDASTSAFSIDFATAPEASAIYKTVQREGKGAGLMVRVPPTPDAENPPKADYEFAAERLEAIAKLPQVKFGKRPELFPLLTDIPVSVERNSPLVNSHELKVMQYLGLNGRDGQLDEQDWQSGLRFNTLGASIWYRGEAGYTQPQEDKMHARAEHFAQNVAPKIRYPEAAVYTKMMDEAGAQSLAEMAKHDFNHQAFRKWLSERDHAPLTDAQIVDARIVTGPDDDPVLYYYSQRFRAWAVANFFRVANDVVTGYYPQHAEPTQNFSDGAVYGANFYLQGNDYFQYFREFGDGAMAGAQSEDWTNHGATHQLCGWNVALLRSATRVHGQPIFMYVISSFGRPPLVVKLKSMTDIAEGAEVLRYYSYSPKYASHEHGFSQRYPLFSAIAEVSREIGAAEYILKNAAPVQAETAIIYSVPTDIWTVGKNAAFGNERMSTWLALEHAQTPVDVVSDEDVVNNYLADAKYKVAYLHGEQIDTRMAEPLANFVKQGGRLVLGAGAGSRDKFNNPSGALDKALGIQRGQLEHLQQYWHASMYMCRGLQPKGVVTLKNTSGEETGTTDLLAMRQTFEPQQGDVVLATGQDGEALALRRRIGKGSIDLVGFLPAMAYLREARLEYENEQMEEQVKPLRIVAEAMVAVGDAEGNADDVRVPRPQHANFPTGFEPHVRDFIVASTDETTRPVGASHPMVSATLMESDKGYAIILANWSGEPIERLQIDIPLKFVIRPDNTFGNWYSSRHGRLGSDIHSTGPTLPFVISLESTDILYFGKE